MSYKPPIKIIESVEDIPQRNLDRWTLSAIECYFEKSDCTKCPIAKMLETPCYMHLTVKLLLKKFGKPSKELYKELLAESSSKIRNFKEIKK